jgi:hypothetical protein
MSVHMIMMDTVGQLSNPDHPHPNTNNKPGSMSRIFSWPVRYNNASKRNHIAVGASKLLRINLSRD